jgi:hypothetical protein
MTRAENSFPAIGQVPDEMSVNGEDSPRPRAPSRPGSRRGAERATHKDHASCDLCGRSDGELKVYRDPFGTAISPGRWPNLTMHSDCFLAYIRARKAAVRELTS